MKASHIKSIDCAEEIPTANPLHFSDSHAKHGVSFGEITEPQDCTKAEIESIDDQVKHSVGFNADTQPERISVDSMKPAHSKSSGLHSRQKSMSTLSRRKSRAKSKALKSFHHTQLVRLIRQAFRLVHLSRLARLFGLVIEKMDSDQSTSPAKETKLLQLVYEAISVEKVDWSWVEDTLFPRLFDRHLDKIKLPLEDQDDIARLTALIDSTEQNDSLPGTNAHKIPLMTPRDDEILRYDEALDLAMTLSRSSLACQGLVFNALGFHDEEVSLEVQKATGALLLAALRLHVTIDSFKEVQNQHFSQSWSYVRYNLSSFPYTFYLLLNSIHSLF